MKLKIVNNSLRYPSVKIEGGSAISIGNFDGCHIGHQDLIAAVRKKGIAESLNSTIVSFNPRPEDYFRPNAEPHCLFSENQKERALDELGVDIFVNQQFNKEFIEVSHEQFFDDYLKRDLKAEFINVGENFCFGHRRKGSAYWLKERCQSESIDFKISSPTKYKDEIVSSTRIRRKLRNEGRVEEATDMLGRPYLLEGEIVKGNQIGRTIGVPTANLGKTQQLIPKTGVYCGYVWIEPESGELPPIMSLAENKYPAVFNIGHRPTVEKDVKEIRIEAHLLSGNWGINSLYGKRAGYWFTKRIRDEVKFSGLDELKNQIKIDIQQAASYL